jgi:predicted GIY-YIG superfamily endonuclease
MKYVYEIINTYGTVEYVGESVNPEKRFWQHTKSKRRHGAYGKFYGRHDLLLNIVANFETTKEAWHFQKQLQLEYGLKTDDAHTKDTAKSTHQKLGLDWTKQTLKKAREAQTDYSSGGKVASSIIRTCECGKSIKGPAYFSHIKKCNK